MAKRAHHYRLRLEHMAPAATDQPTHPPLEVEFDNHDDIFQIIERLQARNLFAKPSQATEFAIGLKLFSEVMLNNRDHALFAEMRPAFSEFMKKLKSGGKPTEEQPKN
ncbi:DUF3861 domain-containing protein (plasmid) [Hymenobacter tibetensis]|uniref:DUF3861 domain-containing protein n=1 Tax=Hymenobacter tibetensis TaxID=497967 RepID=A0ABY4D554_9BACT|nr:DUF3861 domain-containing protein [Hymenobacter tibetensis]UOG77488.1 DUF3861 domain-containing protein [Hymenobacter tibetensis]